MVKFHAPAAQIVSVWKEVKYEVPGYSMKHECGFIQWEPAEFFEKFYSDQKHKIIDSPEGVNKGDDMNYPYSNVPIISIQSLEELFLCLCIMAAVAAGIFIISLSLWSLFMYITSIFKA